MTKKDYLQNKGILPPDLGVMYIVTSTRAGVTMREVPIWDVRDNVISVFRDDEMCNIESKTYKFKEAPFELTIMADDTYGEEHGYGTGFGDLWSWSHFGSLDKEVAEKILHDEKIRVAKTYQLMF